MSIRRVYIGINTDELPIVAALDIVGVIVDLRLIAGNCSSLSVETRA